MMDQPRTFMDIYVDFKHKVDENLKALENEMR